MTRFVQKKYSKLPIVGADSVGVSTTDNRIPSNRTEIKTEMLLNSYYLQLSNYDPQVGWFT